LHLIVEIAELALVPHLHGTAAPAAVLPDTNAFRVVAVGTERRTATGAHPFVAAFVPAFLLVQSFAQSFHQFLESAELFDRRALFWRQRQLGAARQPVRRQPGRVDSGEQVFHALEIFAEGEVIPVVVALVFHEHRARQAMEGVHGSFRHASLQGRHELQPLIERHRYPRLAQHEEKPGKHGARTSAPSGAVQEDQPLEQMHVLLVLQQCAVQRRQRRLAVTGTQRFRGNVLGQQQLEPVQQFGG
jgi:hypothetical protein